MRDRVTLPISDEAASNRDYLEEEVPFAEKVQAYKFALAYSIQNGFEPHKENVSRTTYLNLGSFDPDNEIQNLIHALEITPSGMDWVDVVISLAEQGLEHLATLHKQGEFNLLELVTQK